MSTRSLAALRDWQTARHERSLRAAASVSRRARVLSPLQRWLRVLALSLVVILFGGFLDSADSWGLGWGFGWFEGYTYNLASALRARFDDFDKNSSRAVKRSKSNNIVIVSLSDETFSPANFSSLPGPPVPRNYHAKLIRFLSECGAKVIAFDLLFDVARPEDKELAAATREAIKRGTHIVWGCFVDDANQLVIPNTQLRHAGGQYRALACGTKPDATRD